MDPGTIAGIAMGGTSLLKGLFGGGGGAAPNITKQDNTQVTSVNVSVGSMADAARASLPFPGATSASFATPIGYSADGYQPTSGGGYLMQTIHANAPLIVLALGAVLLMKKLNRGAA